MERELGHLGQCEVVDLIPTGDDVVAMRCEKLGRVIEERDKLHDRVRWRCVCPDPSGG